MIYGDEDLSIKDAKHQVYKVLDFINQTDEVNTVYKISEILNYFRIYTVRILYLLKEDKKLKEINKNGNKIYVK